MTPANRGFVVRLIVTAVLLGAATAHVNFTADGITVDHPTSNLRGAFHHARKQ